MNENSKSSDFKTLDTAFMGHPKPLRSLFFTEMWERFSYYGIRPLLVLFMTAAIAQGGLGIDDANASAIYGIFAGSMYLMPILGGWLADNWLGQERALWWGSIIIALGHLSIGMSAFLSIQFFFLGLVLLVIGSGLFKTCISVMVGALYDKNDARRDAGFTLFYMGINLGAFLAPLITGIFKEQQMWHAGFTVGGVGMLISLAIYKLFGKKNLTEFANAKNTAASWEQPKQVRANVGKFVGVGVIALSAFIILVMMGVITLNPVLIASVMTYVIAGSVSLYFAYCFVSPVFTKPEKLRLLVCFLLVVGSTFFWSSFEQQPTSFNLFAERYTDLNAFGMKIPTVWFQSLNSLFILVFAPIVSIMWVRLAAKKIQPNSMVKFALGMFFAAAGFVLMIIASQGVVNNGGLASPWWLVGSLFLLTIGELMLSPAGLSSMTKLAPDRMQGVVMGLFFASIALGSLVASFSGGSVSADTIENLPKLFTTLTIFLVVCGVILIAVSRPVARMLKEADNNVEI
ncbi:MULTISPECIES: peptide MFS transporter [unclassified Moraxella]|uniref:peptide MFS transporter n=1 Tax=unclassified Moraxella TaxID=2685852 RepID=UPI00359EC8C7